MPRLLRWITPGPLRRPSQDRDHRAGGRRRRQDEAGQQIGYRVVVTYAVPRQPAPTVCENTRVRTRPRIRDRMVRPGDDGGAAVSARTEPPRGTRIRIRTRRLGLDRASNFAGLHMQLPVLLHARPPPGDAPLVLQNPESAGNRIFDR